jgi:hypothetical protein
LFAALPGLREIRSSLAGGYLWLLFAWLCLDPVLRDHAFAGGAYESVSRLGEVTGPLALGVATAFVAYLVGSLVDELRHAASNLYLQTRSTPFEQFDLQIRRRYRRLRNLSRQVEGKPSTVERNRSRQVEGKPATDRDFDRRRSVLAPVEQLGRAFETALRQLGRAFEAALRQLAEGLTVGSRSLTRVAGLVTEAIEESIVLILRTLTAGRVEPYKAYVTPAGVRAMARRLKELEGRPHDESVAEPGIAEVIQDFPRIRARLLSGHVELVSEVDRLTAESEFRLAILPPLLALCVFMAVDVSTWWLAALPFLAPFYSQARERRREAGDVLADSFAMRLVESPTIEEYLGGSSL